MYLSSRQEIRRASDFRTRHRTTALRIFPEGEVFFRGKGNGPTNQLCQNLALIDVDGNDRYDIRSTDRGHKFTEPCLGTSLRELKRLGELAGTEVLTCDDIELQVRDCAIESPFFGKKRLVESRVRDASTIIEEAIPGETKNLKWAVDLANREFLIYQPSEE